MLEDSYKHKGMRRALVKKIANKGIEDPGVLEAINSVPRHFFLDKVFVEKAYQDIAFPIEEGQTISQPYTVAFQTQLLNVQKHDKILEIGTGSGYQCCVLLEMGAKVFSIEYNQRLCEKAKKFLPKMGYHPRIFCGDGSKGLEMFAPFNKIIVTAGAPFVPEALKNQLEIGGVLVIPVGNSKTQKMLRITRISENEFKEESKDHFSFVPLRGEYGWK
ncbi:protein-L-isoaspartate(D-aspartate) O-methyltransferase [Fulvivirgaceae bacterium BMA10]|uniref:Protein-L-isoaspartate O-methyltransferase n=1 Tax=Splendidivirga corallicola TaxID=3051826 RepID=A0ABT8KG91_9BACT|nr:protein-L-isoaspartate(D-aspartate) O-methyltransferase [Fulvivirgaceae bacterium BMA10]